MKHTNFYAWTYRSLFVACLFICQAKLGWAVNVTSLYKVTVPVASELEDQRDLAESDGFLKVLIRLTSDPDIVKNPVIKANLYRPEYYVRDFSYSPVSRDSSQYSMQINFDKDEIARLLTKASVPYWVDSRPLTIGWLAVTNKQSATEVVGADSVNPIYSLVKEQSKKLGVPLIFPVMDMSEMNTVGSAQIDEVALPELKLASKRYSPDALLIAQIKEDDNTTVGYWTLIMNANQWNWTVSEITPDRMVAAAMTQISQTMVRQHVLMDDAKKESWINITVMNINGNDDLTQLMQYMQRLAPVEKVQLSQVTEDTAALYLLIKGNLTGLEKNVALGKRLQLKLRDVAANKLTYQWVR